MKIIFKILTIGILGIVFLLFLFIQYLKSDLNNSFHQSDIQKLKAEVKSAEELPKKFLEVYNITQPITNTTEELFNCFFENYNNNCPCLEIANFKQNLTMNNNRITGNKYILAWKLEKEVTQQECLKFLVAKHDFLYNNIGIEKASKFYFDSSLDSLNEEQMMILTLMIKNPAFYNPKINPEGVNEELEKIKSFNLN